MNGKRKKDSKKKSWEIGISGLNSISHLEAEIMLVDEVLAVGDYVFQKKCLGKLDDVAKVGRTILFVSHNISSIIRLCNKCLLLSSGEIIQYDTTKKVVDLYYSDSKVGIGEVDFTENQHLPGDQSAKLLKVRSLNREGKITSEIKISEPIEVEMEYQLLEDNMAVSVSFDFWNSEGLCVFNTRDTPLDPFCELKKKKGIYIARCRIPENFLNDGNHYIGFALTTKNRKEHFYEHNLLLLRIVDPIEGTITKGWYSGPEPGVVRPALHWECERLE